MQQDECNSSQEPSSLAQQRAVSEHLAGGERLGEGEEKEEMRGNLIRTKISTILFSRERERERERSDWFTALSDVLVPFRRQSLSDLIYYLPFESQ